jgi:hypothetical protein
VLEQPNVHRPVMANFVRGLQSVHPGVMAVLVLGAALYMAVSRDGGSRTEASAVTAPHNSAMLLPASGD